MWSHEISAATGQFTQQALMQNAYARQINPFDNRSQAEALSGNLINRGVGFAAPIAKFVGGLAGLDSPLSGAMTWGGIGAMAGGPLGAGIGAGLGAVAGTAGAVAQFGVGNFMTGMQQQQGLNQMLRQNYGFMRPGGYGFTGADMGMIGSQIRSMSHQAGPGGEMHSFAELSQLASNMGRMGFSQNITDVRQFTQKFRQMVDTLKTVSKELGTSLQSAQEMVVGMRQSGIFNTADQIKMAQGIRANNLAGVSMEASSQMANVGSQISRSIGGLGRSGAFAGMRTIQQVGAAMKVGALSEEDIYNATGLTGEQGQMALAQNQMASSARFLKSGRGRYLLASMAGAGGKLDERAVEEFAGGGMGVGRTRQLAGQNLGKVGRANFIRNEGRLRGEVLNKFGGNVNTLALMGWAGERGIDIGAMGDRDMLFAQRMLGMGRDEMDVAVKQANAMGDIGTYMKRQGQQDDYLKGVATVRKNTGVEGLKNTFNRFREHAQSQVQSYGSRAYQDVTNLVERQLNKLFGTYSAELDAQLDDAYTSFSSSGGRDVVAAAKVRKAGGIATSGFKPQEGGFGGGQMSLDRYQKLAQGGGAARILGTAVSPLAMLAPESAEGRWARDLGARAFKAMGGQTLEDQTGHRFKFDPSAKGTAEEQFAQFREQTMAFQKGAGTLPTNEKHLAMAKSLGESLRTAGAAEAMGNTAGRDRAERALAYAAQQGNKTAVEVKRLLATGKKEDVELAASLVNAGLADAHQKGISGKTAFSGGLGQGTFATDQDKTSFMGGLDRWTEAGAKAEQEGGIGASALRGAAWGAGIGTLIMPGVGTVIGAGWGAAISAGASWLKGGASTVAQNRRDEMGAIFRSQRGKEQFFGAMGGGEEMDKAREEWNRLQGGTKEQQESADARFAKLRLMSGLLGKEELVSMQTQMEKGGSFQLSDKAKERMRKEFGKGMTDEQMSAEARNVLGVAQGMTGDQREQMTAALNKQGEMAKAEFERYTRTGVYTKGGGLRAGTEESLRKRGLGFMADQMKAEGARLATTSSLTGLSEANLEAGQSAFESATAGQAAAFRGKSSQQLFQEAAKNEQTARGEDETEADYANRMAKGAQRKSVARERRAAGGSVQQFGEGLAAGKWMGLRMGRDTQRSLYGARGNISKQMAILGEEMQFEDIKDDKGRVVMSAGDQKDDLEMQLRRMSGKANLGYTEKDLAAMSPEKRKRVQDQIAEDKGKGREEIAAESKQKLGAIGREQEKKRRQESADQDPSYQVMKEMATSLKQLSQALTQQNGKDATTARPVTVSNTELSVRILK